MGTILDDIEYLVRSEHRVGVLETLSERSCNRIELCTETGASSSTMSRILSDFEERHWITRDGQMYLLTNLGSFVADRLSEFHNAMELERTVRDIWPWLPHEMEGFNVELFSDTVVSRPGPGYPYQPIDRIAHLLTKVETVRGFGMMLFKSNNLEAFIDHVSDGIECEYIYPPEVFERLLLWDGERVMAAAEQENFTVLLHENLPIDERCGICLFGDRVSFCCIDPKTGMVYALTDTGAPKMRAWAEAKHDAFRAEAEPLSAATDLLSPELLP